MNIEKYSGIIPAFYACYDNNSEVNPEAVRDLTKHLVSKGIKGLYVGGSSGECIYQSVSERKTTLENVIEACEGKITVIAHVACNNTKDSMELAAHAQSVGADAIAAIPPIYFHLPDHAVAQYWNDISSAAPDTDFIIYNIPQLAGIALTPSLYKTMLENPRVIGVKNSSMPVLDIANFRSIGGNDRVVFNGPDEQLASGLIAGANGGIGGTYAVMPELYTAIFDLIGSGNIEKAAHIQTLATEIIFAMCSCTGNLYAVMKEIIRQRDGIDCGGVRKPLAAITEADMPVISKCITMINEAVKAAVH
ncbi:MAG: dihydrodipicolinate synthase family protein [Oscillospiraceae bacterium]|nr:dihydrodipicolinate synthase family protein [Oscillospiraceae bacterium]